MKAMTRSKDAKTRACAVRNEGMENPRGRIVLQVCKDAWPGC
jgi:hypothetical protein